MFAVPFPEKNLYAFGEVAISRDARGNYYAFFCHQRQEVEPTPGEVVAFDLGIKTLAVGTNEQGRIYHIGGFKGSRWYNRQLDKIRSKRDRCKKKSRRYKHLSRMYKRVSEKKRNKQRDGLHKASHLFHGDWLRELSLWETFPKGK